MATLPDSYNKAYYFSIYFICSFRAAIWQFWQRQSVSVSLLFCDKRANLSLVEWELRDIMKRMPPKFTVHNEPKEQAHYILAEITFRFHFVDP